MHSSLRFVTLRPLQSSIIFSQRARKDPEARFGFGNIQYTLIRGREKRYPKRSFKTTTTRLAVPCEVRVKRSRVFPCLGSIIGAAQCVQKLSPFRREAHIEPHEDENGQNPDTQICRPSKRPRPQSRRFRFGFRTATRTTDDRLCSAACQPASEERAFRPFPSVFAPCG